MDRQSVRDVASEALDTWGRVDVLFNNAIYQGPGTMDTILDLPLELAEQCLIGDYIHPLLLIQLLVPQMLERGEGRIVNMLSEAAFITPPAPAGKGGWGVAYAAAKAAFHRVTDVCHVEFFDQGVSSFSIAPGLTLTESMKASGTHKVLEAAGPYRRPPRSPEKWLDGSAPPLRRRPTRVRWSRRGLCAESSTCSSGPPERGRARHRPTNAAPSGRPWPRCPR